MYEWSVHLKNTDCRMAGKQTRVCGRFGLTRPKNYHINFIPFRVLHPPSFPAEINKCATKGLLFMFLLFGYVSAVSLEKMKNLRGVRISLYCLFCYPYSNNNNKTTEKNFSFLVKKLFYWPTKKRKRKSSS